ncbi:hypothetical protein PF005_g9638 [Phytophthora fragariae]|uniref:RNase H type-1 domain-containing protein n=1 Tax=Phytophthora fragariae TaxID=53985 RepID=A0A6A3F1T6_9STRA|nr:hypothetical protein PF009_g10713 [Phytophthora fragariae]KAE9116137.1 hypothetical protein PF007_g9771 [Phytophthora fragariae]KAE9116293.1 hypothetical protein PF010_g9020 [Phytophthora fragariae]KAE9214914.1 hypothetical protein PF005_g9638 [Phytophthora fragariae]KAE9237051.1 hypothetical protein PF004_g8672 [Phytophthora fragariae]
MRVRGEVKEAYERYRLGLYPLTSRTAPRMRAAEMISQKWARVDEEQGGQERKDITYVGFFDGGSRGNPGPGGSGSVVIEQRLGDGGVRPIWAAATALGRTSMTNNVAEFVGLERTLAQAATKGWTGIHVVGDSEMILRMMRTKTPPKAKKLKHWYARTIRLADICRVASWTHHYRRYNKMADWLANLAMDAKKSSMEHFLTEVNSGCTRNC